MDIDFEWDREKAEQNFVKHGVAFEEATTVFADTLSLTITDPLHSEAEERFVITGLSNKGRQLVVVFTERGERVRLISARQATSGERKKYEEGRE
ncbi:MAG TPA: BrnT family toxin [Pyrinomonadaceae bacterium]|nr:BrnT family toxin [Pyrinomonadaceae bacterium]